MEVEQRNMFKLPNQKNKKVSTGRFFNSKDVAAPGTPLIRKKLGIKPNTGIKGTKAPTPLTQRHNKPQ